MRKVFALLIPILLLSGCLSTAENTVPQEAETLQIVEQIWENNSYQFWNLAPMSMGNITTFSFNETGDVNITVELDVFFHEPLIWEQGHLNYTLIHGNETVFSHELSEGEMSFHINVSNVSNITMEIRASGTDNATDTHTGDWFIARTHCEMKKEI